MSANIVWGLILLLGASWHKSLTGAVKVFTFRPDGQPSVDTVGIYKGPLDRSRRINSVSMCARVNIYFLHGQDTFFQFQDTVLDNKYMLKAEIWLDRVRPVIANKWNFQMLKEKLRSNEWHHFCFLYDHMRKTYTTYVDGELTDSLSFNVGLEVYGDLAQIGQGAEINESFSGQLTQLNVWDRPLTMEEVRVIAKCQEDLEGNFISWNSEWETRNAIEEEKSLAGLCETLSEVKYFLFPSLPMSEGIGLCESLGSHLPLPRNQEDVTDLYIIASSYWPNSTRCKHGFLVPLTDDAIEGEWRTVYDNKNIENVFWQDGEPNGNIYENCARIEKFGIVDVDCYTRTHCVVCPFETRKIYSLLGTCAKELRNMYFLAYQDKLGHIIFKGYGEYRIYNDNHKWLWIDMLANVTIASLMSVDNAYPMGRQLWELHKPVCQQASGIKELTLTPCTTLEYTCDNAACIPIAKRCDRNYDCLDHSDEHDCQLVYIDQEYRGDLAPQVNDLQVFTTQLNVSIDFVQINTNSMSMQASFQIGLAWYDERLTFANLKKSMKFNTLPPKAASQIWSPRIDFVNTFNNNFGNEETYMQVKRESNSTGRNDSSSREDLMFPGKDNALFMYHKYSKVFSCEFDLFYYPFDKQSCLMHIRLLLESTKQIVLNPISAEYKGFSSLAEYEIKAVEIHRINSEEHYEVAVRLLMRRQSGYIILNIYTPSIIILTISYLTLFFSPHAFQARVTICLLSLLVIVTLFIQVSFFLPKATYVKILDIWLIFCIFMVFLITILHTVIDTIFKEDDKVHPIKIQAIFPSESGMKRGGTHRFTVPKNKTYPFVIGSRIVIIVLFVLFNLLYWSLAFKSHFI